MTPKEKPPRANGGAKSTTHASPESTTATDSAQGGRTGRRRYVRLFPERLDFLLAHLSPHELSAYLRVLSEYCVRDGVLSADDAKLRKVAKLSGAAWAKLRESLTFLGIAHINGAGLWVDDDQDANLEIQRKTSARQRERALKRWPRAA